MLAGSGGDGTLSYAATPLPVGLSFDDSSLIISGTPTGTGPTTVRYTVTDSDGDSDYVDFTITVAGDLMPSAPSVDNFTAKQNSPFSQQLLAGSGGDGTLSYAATPLPVGLSFDDSSLIISGTPTGTGPTTVRYTVTDSDGDSDYVDFTITVAGDLMPSAPSVDNFTAKQNSPFTQQLLAGSGGDGTLSYAATPLPVGLSFDDSSLIISGTPTGTGPTTVRYTVTDSDGDSDYVDFTITVAGDLTPSAPSVDNFTAKQNSPFSQQLLAGSGGDGTLSYAATPLPVGLSFDDSSLIISGTPTGTGPTTVRYTVTDSDGDSDYVDFTITVVADLKPTLERIDDTSAKLTKVFTLQLTAGSGGDGDLEHDAAGLPDGLTFVQSSRTITGTPTSAKDFEVTYTASDEDNDEARQTFHIVVYDVALAVAK